MSLRLAGLAVVALALAGCSDDPEVQAAPSPVASTPSPTPAATEAPVASSAPVTPEPLATDEDGLTTCGEYEATVKVDAYKADLATSYRLLALRDFEPPTPKQIDLFLKGIITVCITDSEPGTGLDEVAAKVYAMLPTLAD